MESQLMAIVGEGKKGRTYLQPISSNDDTSRSAKLQNVPDTDLPKQALGFRVQIYGMTKHRDLFTYRQLIALNTFSSLVKDAKEHAYNDAIRAKMASDDTALADDGLGSRAYSDAIASYLAFAVDKMVDTNTILCTWQVDPPRLRATFGRQALQMTWDYAEANIFGDAAGDFQRCFGSICEILDRQNPVANGFAAQLDAGLTIKDTSLSCPIISTDPPYYDNIGYADLSDIFYIWLRSSIGSLYPTLFSTLLTPKAKEL
jgi:putative DNA methylase